MSRIIIDSGAIKRLARDPAGGIARELEFITANTVEWDVKNALNVPAPYTIDQKGREVYPPHPPPGPPWARSGRMWSSVDHERPKVDAIGLHCDITISAVNDAGFAYPSELLRRRYRFTPPGSKRYVYRNM